VWGANESAAQSVTTSLCGERIDRVQTRISDFHRQRATQLYSSFWYMLDCDLQCAQDDGDCHAYDSDMLISHRLRHMAPGHTECKRHQGEKGYTQLVI
jgi:hypothetical protein